ncbi:MAG: hypothetical protein U5L96_13905 [Owenweeksia sp.]|nr:hypothetical protein [Owenweeksia sp.]
MLFILFNIPLYWFSGDFKPRYYYMFLPFLSFLLAYVYEPHRQPVLAKVVKGIFALTAILLPIGLATLPFIPAMEVVPQLHTRVFICLVITVAAAFLYFKSAHKIAAMVVLMAVARLCLNTIYMPAFENDPQVGHYRALIKEMLKITGDAPIYMTGDAYIFKSEAAIGPISFEEVTLKTAPLMGYKFPYYVTSQNGHVLQFTEEVLPGRYYLVPERMSGPIQ